MKTMRTRDKLAIVLKMEPSLAGAAEVPYSAHVILNRCVIDDDGNICLTAPAGLLSVLDLIDQLKAELDGLGNEAVLCLAQAITLSGNGVANDNGQGAPGFALYPALPFLPPGQSP
jgi:hypothetical protein